MIRPIHLVLGVMLLANAAAAGAEDYNGCLAKCDQTYTSCIAILEGYVYGDVPRAECRSTQQVCWDKCLEAESAPPVPPAAQEPAKSPAPPAPSDAAVPDPQGNPDGSAGAPDEPRSAVPAAPVRTRHLEDD